MQLFLGQNLLQLNQDKKRSRFKLLFTAVKWHQKAFSNDLERI